MTLIPKWTGSAVDLEHYCECCKTRKAVVIFDNQQLCAICCSLFERKLIEEGMPRRAAIKRR